MFALVKRETDFLNVLNFYFMGNTNKPEGIGWGDVGTAAAMEAANNLMGVFMAGWNDKRQLKQQQKLQDLQIAGQKQMMDYQQQLGLEMWEKTNYKAQLEQMKKAGLSPGLMYGKGGPGGSLAMPSGSVSGGNAPVGDPLRGGMGIQSMLAMEQLKQMRAQTRSIEIDNANKDKGGIDYQGKEVGISEAQSRISNNILEGVIKKYAGKEAQDYYERVKSPNRGVEAKTYQDELEARQGVAGTIYELWVEGKLKDKSDAEIEQAILNVGKTKEEINKLKEDIELLKRNIKLADMNNVMTELEMKMQQQTGIDKNSPWYLKMFGRLFSTFFAK